MMCIIAIVAAKIQRAGELLMPELAMRPLAAGNDNKPHSFEVGDQLANLARHTQYIDTIPPPCQ